MSEAIVKHAPQALDTADWTREKIELIKRTVAMGATDDELQLFLYTAKRTGLDPLAKQIHAVKRWNSQAGREVMTVQTGIDGYRLIADRTGKLAGIDDPQYDTDAQPHPGKAVVTVRKLVDGSVCEFSASARWAEYVQTKKDGTPTQMWAKMPYLMLGKCAEALALRKAFPADLSGVYTFEEMSQADTDDAKSATPPRGNARPSPAQQSPQARPQEKVICAHCLSSTGHTEDCPTRNPPEAKAEPKKQPTGTPTNRAILHIVQVKDMVTKPRKNAKTGVETPGTAYSILSFKVEDKVYDLFCFHQGLRQYAHDWVGQMCDMELLDKPKSDKSGNILTLEKMHRAGDVQYIDNEPVIDGEVTPAEVEEVNPF